MNSEQIARIIRSFLEGRGVSIPEISGKTDLFDAGVIDSFGFIELVSVLEETFQVQLEFADLEPEQFACMDAIVELVRSSDPVGSGVNDG